MSRDIFISILGHLTLVALVIIINPATSILGNGPEIMTLNLGLMDLPESGSNTQVDEPPPQIDEEEITALPPPEMPEILADDMIEEAVNVRSNEPLAKIEKPQEKPKPKKKPKQEVKQQEQQSEEKDQPKETEGSDGKKRLDVQGNVGAGGDGSAIGSGQSNLPYNMRMLERKVERVWRNPVRSSEPVSCEVYFVINRDGSLVGTPTIAKSSGLSVFDNEAIYSILRVGQFPAFPIDFEYDELGITLQVEYRP